MFRVRRAAETSTILCRTVALLLVMVAAVAANAWLVVEVRKEQRAIQEIMEGGVAEDIERLGTLPGEVPWQLLVTVLVLIVLIAAGSGLLFMVRAYAKSLESLREIKILAWDILASMDQGVITTNQIGQITSVNPRAQELLSVDFDCVGHPLSEICQNGQALVTISSDVIKTGRAKYDHDFLVTRNGHPVQLRTECHVLRGNHGDVSGSVLHIRDVTERGLLEERMKRMERFMRLGTLAAGLHHEIKNPLSALSLHVQLLEERLEGRADDETAAHLGVLKTEITRISGVLESFRDYASIETLSQVETDIPTLVRRTVDLIRPKAEHQHVQVAVNMPDASLPKILADPTRLEQVLLNLVVNSLEEMNDGGRLELAVDTGNGMLTIEVIDNGRGIPENVRARIFDPYFTTKSDGSGMGLAVCDKIIRQHNGQIDVEAGSPGTTFRISLPVVVSDG